MTLRPSRWSALALVLVLGACADEEIPTEALRPLAPGSAGYRAYEAVLEPVNAGARGRAAGTVRVETDGERLYVRVEARGLESGARHATQLRGHPAGAAGACPTTDADLDGSGRIDPAEATPAAGPVLVTLDPDPTGLRDPAAFPAASRVGVLEWEGIGPVSDAEARIRAAFGPAAALQPLDRRQVVLHALPAEPGGAGLPVACGSLHRVR